ncbi:MAG: RdgB/HAM1 family non-canonical purine NTP pyrophosphatase [bacterium]|nr:RdgB/HAM1 family non-canonical purine NTP pyrophosphatase [bacterium]
MNDARALRWVLATLNAGKVREFAAGLQGTGIRLAAAVDLGLDRFPPETGATYEENALGKAGFAAVRLGRVALADDSGLEVDALGGAPGVRSARFGGPGLTDGERIAHLLDRIKHVPRPQRTARFVAVIVVASPSGAVATFQDSTEGTILLGPRGDGGFGYDPVFHSTDLGMTFAESTVAEKQRVSHRGRALARLRDWLGTTDAAPFLD